MWLMSMTGIYEVHFVSLYPFAEENRLKGIFMYKGAEAM